MSIFEDKSVFGEADDVWADTAAEGIVTVTEEQFKMCKKAVLAFCDRSDESGFVPKEIYEAKKIRMSETEDQGKILVGENADGDTAFVYSPQKASLKTYSRDESGHLIKNEYTDNRALMGALEYREDLGAFPVAEHPHLTSKAKGELDKMVRRVENTRQLNPALMGQVKFSR